MKTEEDVLALEKTTAVKITNSLLKMSLAIEQSDYM